MKGCKVCGSERISQSLSVCLECLRKRPGSIEIVRERRERWRTSTGLPPYPPRGGKLRCPLCVNGCELDEGDRGYCGTVINRNGLRPLTGSWNLAIGLYYLDPLPTNCVATPVCPAATCRGYPEFTDVCGPEIGRYNLAIFYGSCNLDCFFCQNAEHKRMASMGRSLMSLSSLLREALRNDVTCICAFGGDPSPWTPQLFSLYRKVRDAAPSIKRMCWETNGLQDPEIFLKMAEASLESGGIVKVDLKAWTSEVYEALTGVRGRDRVVRNLREASKLAKMRNDPPLIVVSTLMVPYYIDLREIESIADFLSSLDADIPYVLLAFHPEHLARDLPLTTREFAEEAVKVAEESGLEVYIGNEWLLS
ncbi:MAG: radical SAM protein [Candidatus Korarchaeota archaeon]|nr:radical SAM protein [Candidatus Korarchaeota archaeon]